MSADQFSSQQVAGMGAVANALLGFYRLVKFWLRGRFYDISDLSWRDNHRVTAKNFRVLIMAKRHLLKPDPEARAVVHLSPTKLEGRFLVAVKKEF